MSYNDKDLVIKGLEAQIMELTKKLQPQNPQLLELLSPESTTLTSYDVKIPLYR